MRRQWLRTTLVVLLAAPIVFGATPDDLVPTGTTALSQPRGAKQRGRRRRFVPAATRGASDQIGITVGRPLAPDRERDRLTSDPALLAAAPAALLGPGAFFLGGPAQPRHHRTPRRQYLWNCAFLL